MVLPSPKAPSDTPAPVTPLAATPPPEADTESARSFDEFRLRFLQEAWVTGAMEHPGVVPVHELAEICGRALAREREERYPTVDELATDLRRWLTEGSIDRAPWVHGTRVQDHDECGPECRTRRTQTIILQELVSARGFTG